MKDIETRNDIEVLVHAFYRKALTDETIGYFFTEVAPLKMDIHIPLIVDFWETVLFGNAAYRGNVVQVHQHIHRLSAFREEHFQRWVFLFMQTVDELYTGEKAEMARQRAQSIATILSIKTLHGGIGLP